MSISIKTYDRTSNLVRYDLDKLRVFIEDDHLQPQFFDVEFLPTYLSYGKHAFNVSFHPPDNEFQFVENSLVLFEFKDRDGKVIYSKAVGPFDTTKTYETTFNGYDKGGKGGFGFVDIQQNALDSYFEIPDGTAHMTIVGELSGVPPEWQGKYNVRLSIPIIIKKNIENTSPLIFGGEPDINAKMKIATKSGARGALPSLIETFAFVSFDNLHAVGGSLDTINLNYISDASDKNSYQLLDRFKMEPVELLTATHSRVDQHPQMSDPGYPIGQFTSYTSLGDDPYSSENKNWNQFRGIDGDATNVGNMGSGQSNTASNGNHIMSGSAIIYYGSGPAGKDGGLGKLIRRTTDDEIFDIQYNISGSARFSIWYSTDKNDFNLSDPGTMPCPHNPVSHSMHLAYSASFIDFNPSGSVNSDGIFTPYSGSFLNGNLVTTASSNYNDPVGENQQIIKDTFSIPSGSWFAFYMQPVSASTGVSPDRYAWVSNISIKHTKQPGKSQPHYYNIVELSGFASREEELSLQASYDNPAGQNGISILNPVTSYTSSFSPLTYFPEGFSIERGYGNGYKASNNPGGSGQGISVGAKFSNITSGSFNENNTGWAAGSASIGIWGEAAFGGDVDIGGLYESTFDGIFPGMTGYGSSGPDLYGDKFTRGKTVGGFFAAARHTASDNFTVGLQVAAWESSSAGWMTASNADNLWSARFEVGDVFIGDNLIVSGNIEANEYIISSSTTYYTQSQYNGSSNFGDGCDDVHSFSGSIIQDCGTGTYFSSSAGSIEISGSFGEAHLHVDGHITASGHISASGVFSQNIHTLTQNNATPSVAAGNLFITNNTSATTITGLTNGVVGQEVTIVVNDTNTDFQDGTNFNLFRSLDWTTATTNDVLRMLCVDGTKWVSTGRLDNS